MFLVWIHIKFVKFWVRMSFGVSFRVFSYWFQNFRPLQMTITISTKWTGWPMIYQMKALWISFPTPPISPHLEFGVKSYDRFTSRLCSSRDQRPRRRAVGFLTGRWDGTRFPGRKSAQSPTEGPTGRWNHDGPSWAPLGAPTWHFFEGYFRLFHLFGLKLRRFKPILTHIIDS